MAEKSEPVGGPELLLSIERREPGSLHEQLEHRLRERVRSGQLPAGTRLPSSRALAATLGVSRGVVLEAYSQLVAEGYLTASQGAPTRVADTLAGERPPLPAALPPSLHRYDFNPVLPDLTSFPRERWLRSVRVALRSVPFIELGRREPRGTPELRNELMSYLARVRGAAPEPEHTLICGGFSEAFATLCRALRQRGVEQVALETPSWAQYRMIVEGAGLAPVPVAVDDHGIVVSSLRDCGCEVVVVSPAHQFPAGAVLAAERRAALLEWAEDEDALIVEDDYDSELSYGRVAVGALQGLAPERVCHIGSTSQRLVPGVCLGWILSPSWLTGALTFEHGVAGAFPPVIDQLALADFIRRGELDRHLRRMRLRYRSRREKLLAALGSELAQARVHGSEAGVYVLVELPAGADEHAVVSAAAARGVAVDGLASHSLRTPRTPGLIIGFGNLSDGAIARGISLLGDAVRAAAAGAPLPDRTS